MPTDQSTVLTTVAQRRIGLAIAKAFFMRGAHAMTQQVKAVLSAEQAVCLAKR